MGITINIKKSYERGEWFEMPGGGRFKIRPYPASRENLEFSRTGGLVVSGEEQFRKFSYCLMEWEDVLDDEGNPVPLNDETKRVVYDLDLGGIPAFVLGKVRELASVEAETEKNSKAGAGGSSRKR